MAPTEPRAAVESSRAPAARRWPRRAGRVLVVAAALLLVVLASHPWWLGRAASRYLTSTAGRPVHFDSVRLGLASTGAALVRLRGVRIANAPWADASRPFAVFEEVEFEFTGRRDEGRWVVGRIGLKNGEVHLERRPDGLRNWRLRDPENRGPGRFWFLVLEAERTALTFTHPGVDLVLRARSRPDDAPAEVGGQGPALPNRVDFEGSFRGVDFRGSTATDKAISLLKSGRWFPIRGHAEVEGVRIELDGRAADLLREPRLEAGMSMHGKSLAKLGPWIGDRHSGPRAFRVGGRLTFAPGRLALAGGTAKLGVTDLAGDVEWSRTEQRHAVRADLRSESADLADLAWLAGRAPDARRAASAARPALVAASAIPASPARPASAPPGAGRAAGWDASLSYAARRLHVADIKVVQSLALKATLARSRLDVSSFDLGIGGGHATGQAGVDLAPAIPSGEARLAWRGVRLESLLPAQDEARRVAGVLQGRATLAAKGSSADALLASASGNATLRLSDGAIASMLDAKMGLQVGKVVRTMLSGNEPLPLPCAAAVIELAAGKARIRSLVLDSANTRTLGSGTIDLRQRTLDLVLTPEAKRPGLLDLGRSIRLSGRIDKPERALVDRVELPAQGPCAAADAAR
jgi:hypothetical protein